MLHDAPHPRAGQTVKVRLEGKPGPSIGPGEYEFTIQDWVDRMDSSGESWMVTPPRNWAVLHYGNRVAQVGLPMDDEVVYGKIDGLGYIIHTSEIVG